jgi:glucuronosyltransferase
VPQKDLLASGRVDMFISHCGNNGRMESLFYGVPLLCVPLFGDQYYNARMVHRRRFGRLVPKEQISEDSFKDELESFLAETPVYRDEINTAGNFVKSDPTSGREVFLFICEHLLAGGDLGFLKNKVLLDQSAISVYNLDVLAVFFLVMVGIIGVLLGVSFAFCRCILRVTKLKTD